ncbi:MAG: alpha/beta hydrolase [Proteobacteria bacterium]|nr:alpha/beta hydrolase [Pseudomonadota bacterium]
MPNATANEIQIEYETFGDKNNSPILMISGLGGQLLTWDKPLCEKLADAGHFIIIYDNRDIGLSTKMEEAGVPDVMAAVTQVMEGKTVNASYTLDDMADDAGGLLDALDIEKAHICGISMGAAICQTVGIRHPNRVLSLIPIYGTTGNPELPPPAPEAIQALLTPPPEGREANIESRFNTFKLIKGNGFPFDEEWHRNLSERSYDRCFYPQGVPRQILATLAHGNRKPALAKVAAPTLVVHGKEDPLVPVEGGKDIADAIRDSELLLIEGMGHDLPILGGAWIQITDRIIEFTAKVDSQ